MNPSEDQGELSDTLIMNRLLLKTLLTQVCSLYENSYNLWTCLWMLYMNKTTIYILFSAKMYDLKCESAENVHYL